MNREPTFTRTIGRSFARVAGDRTAPLIPQARLGGPMPWVIAIMIALTTIAAAGGLALDNLAQNARADISGGLTVQIVEGLPAERDRQAEVAVALLSNLDGVAEVRRVPDSELAALVEPWLGDMGDMGAAIPAPALVDVRLSGPVTDYRLEELRQLMAGDVPSAQIDAQAIWLQPVFDAISSLQWLTIGLVILLGLTSAAAVWLAARSALGSNHETIEIVHLLGGTDGQIARIFQRSIGLDAALGGAIGLALGLIAVFILGQQFARLGSGMVAGGGLGLTDWLAIAAIPVVGVLVAMLTARLTVMSELRRML